MKRKKNKKACHFTTPYHPYINSRIQTVAVEIVGLEDNSYHLIVPVEINGIQGDMIIDTGASVTVVDRQVFPEDLPEEADVQMTSGSVTGQIHDVHLVKAAKFNRETYDQRDAVGCYRFGICKRNVRQTSQPENYRIIGV